MIQALKFQLKQMAEDNKDQFNLHLQKRVGKRAQAKLEKRVRQLILLMPTLVSRIRYYWEQQKTPSQVKKTGVFLFAYLCLDKDHLPWPEYGLFGYLDDAYFTALVYEKVVSEIDAAAISCSPQDMELRKLVADLIKSARLVIPSEAREIDAMFEDLINNNSTRYETVFS